jgi:hypothetical protein
MATNGIALEISAKISGKTTFRPAAVLQRIIWILVIGSVLVGHPLASSEGQVKPPATAPQ